MPLFFFDLHKALKISTRHSIWIPRQIALLNVGDTKFIEGVDYVEVFTGEHLSPTGQKRVDEEDARIQNVYRNIGSIQLHKALQVETNQSKWIKSQIKMLNDEEQTYIHCIYPWHSKF